ncbi:MAG TPA: hypothetical protein VLF93_00395 [Candidatus Saccharimonadales bacterium]|nr:hypothetical protein [Candidatus Saccharimonadales bacterium]
MVDEGQVDIAPTAPAPAAETPEATQATSPAEGAPVQRPENVGQTAGEKAADAADEQRRVDAVNHADEVAAATLRAEEDLKEKGAPVELVTEAHDAGQQAAEQIRGGADNVTALHPVEEAQDKAAQVDAANAAEAREDDELKAA